MFYPLQLAPSFARQDISLRQLYNINFVLLQENGTPASANFLQIVKLFKSSTE